MTFAAKASDATGLSSDELLALEQLIEGIHIIRLNVFSLLKAVEADPAHFGFTDTHPCLTTAVCSDPDHTLFWDTHHLTELGHAFLPSISKML